MSQVEGASAISSRPMIGTLGGVGVLLLGLASIVFAVSFASRSPELAPPPTLSNTPLVASVPGPGFKLLQLGTFRRDQFLVDQATGRMWQEVCMGKAVGPDCNGTLVWQEVYVDGITPKDSPATWAYNEALKAQTATPSK